MCVSYSPTANTEHPQGSDPHPSNQQPIPLYDNYKNNKRLNKILHSFHHSPQSITMSLSVSRVNWGRLKELKAKNRKTFYIHPFNPRPHMKRNIYLNAMGYEIISILIPSHTQKQWHKYEGGKGSKPHIRVETWEGVPRLHSVQMPFKKLTSDLIVFFLHLFVFHFVVRLETGNFIIVFFSYSYNKTIYK